MNNKLSLMIVLSISFAFGFTADADVGDPIAIRVLPRGGIEIESMWNSSVVISVAHAETSSKPGVDVVLKGVKLPQNQQRNEQANDRVLVDLNVDQPVDFVFDRAADEPRSSWRPYAGSEPRSANAIRVRTFDDSQFVVVDVDGVRISHMRVAGEPSPRADATIDIVSDTDLMVFTTAESDQDLVRAVEQSKHSFAVETVVIGTRAHPDAVGNTMAVSATDPSRVAEAAEATEPALVVLSRQPVELSDELVQLIEAKEAACEASQRVFAELTVEQMNFRPPNGTHTPRWNAEHMMGRELLFFSQIYHALEPAIPVMDLNPQQMPPDYDARHADWSGREEALQMARVSAFTRRFAYLLQDIPLDEAAPGSRWTLRGLLRQMERHYNEHTENVKKKFELDSWPKG